MSNYMFEKPRNSSPNEAIVARCCVHFRPKLGWNGKGYGFDWMRMGDTGEFGDQKPYIDIVGRQYDKKTGDLVQDVNAFEGVFEDKKQGDQEHPLYNSLKKKEYASMDVFWKHEKRADGTLAFGEYLCPWLSLYPAEAGSSAREELQGWSAAPLSKSYDVNTKAELRLYLDIQYAPESLEFEFPDQLEVTPRTITSGLEKGAKRFWKGDDDKTTITVTCKKPLREDAAIKVYAIERNLAGNTERNLAGKLWVCANGYNNRKEQEVVWVKVKTPVGITNNRTKISNISTQLAMVEQSFRQALITPIITPVDLDLSQDKEFAKYYVKDKLIICTYEDETQKPPGFSDLHLFLLDRLRKKTQKTYFDPLFVFSLEANGGVYLKSQTVDLLGGGTLWGIVVLFIPETAESTAHELFHASGVHHSFSNDAPYTYRSLATENLMDYSSMNHKQCYALWRWQWKRVNQNIGTKK